MQRLFPAFPSGRPGAGLLLLRSAVGASLAVQGLSCFARGGPGPWTWAFGPLAAATGASLLIGFLTPAAGALAASIGLAAAFSLLPPSVPDVLGGEPAAIFAVAMAVAVVLLGPGAFSLDARLFGRREVVIPHLPGLPPED